MEEVKEEIDMEEEDIVFPLEDKGYMSVQIIRRGDSVSIKPLV